MCVLPNRQNAAVISMALFLRLKDKVMQWKYFVSYCINKCKLQHTSKSPEERMKEWSE